MLLANLATFVSGTERVKTLTSAEKDAKMNLSDLFLLKLYPLTFEEFLKCTCHVISGCGNN